ncbi:DUF6283 family protein [Massilia sp. X63]|uniref:DUF6283 family protein n=1 Tax=Massilia sp. X63 TaxID=3237285 RepID=UPI0034DCDBE4
MTESCTLRKSARPCRACPWREDASARDIPNFDMDLAESLAATCPDERGMGPDFSVSLFACHKSREGKEIACAGWLAMVGHRHPQVRLAVLTKRLTPSTLEPGAGWPALHTNYQQVLKKLRATNPAPAQTLPPAAT